jgi:hypothetical protein
MNGMLFSVVGVQIEIQRTTKRGRYQYLWVQSPLNTSWIDRFLQSRLLRLYQTSEKCDERNNSIAWTPHNSINLQCS